MRARVLLGAAPAFLLALAAAGARVGDEPAPAPDHPSLDVSGRRVMEFRGELEAGYRWVSGEEGRFAEDVNLGEGLRLFRFDLEGEGLEEGLAADRVRLRARGLGDPDRRVELAASRRGSYDFLAWQDRQDYSFRATYDPHPFDTERERTGGRLRIQAAKGLSVTLETDRLTRRGDSSLDAIFRAERTFPVAAPVRYDRRSAAAGLDWTGGAFRFGARRSWSRASDDSLRTLDVPDTPEDDLGTFETDSRIRGGTTTAHAGVRLFRGVLDVAVLGSRSDTRTGSTFRQRAVSIDPGLDGMPGGGDDMAFSQERRGSSEASLREWTGRVEVTILPADAWEVLGRAERIRGHERASLDMGTRQQNPPFSDPGMAFTPFSERLRSAADQDRESVDVAWRASRKWRSRAGGEHVAERVRAGGDDSPDSSPVTTAATAGADFTPSDRFDASLLLRHARGSGVTTSLGTDVGNSLSLRLRARRPDGFHGTGFVRLKERETGGPDSRVSYDAFGASFGQESAKGSFDVSATRQRFLVASDTRFATNLVLDLRRVRYDERADSFTLEFTREVSGPLRVFGAARWVHGTGDLPSTSRDASLGLGWRVGRGTEVKLEGRAVAFDERRRNADDYGARIFTLSLVQEF